ncbi:MAG TPA: hypothetical protein VFB41_06560 [Solirubrobacteraceae bacterium]|nr:hypothetical protein [Solirubrobacteraceae bacterium]
MQDAPVSFAYLVRELPPERFPFRRWRWELWQGALLVAAGWVTTPRGVERALRRAGSRRLHHLAGVTALRPDRARLLDTLTPDRPARLETGVGTCLLVAANAPETDAVAA